MFDIKRFIARFKKYMVLLLVFPVLLGLAGWLLPVGKMPAKYTATTTLSLGNYDDVDLNTQSRVVLLLSHSQFYQKQLPHVWVTHQQELLANLQVTPLKDQLIQLSITGRSKQDAMELTRTIADAFLSLDQQHFGQRKAVIQETIHQLKNSTVSPDTVVEEQTFLYKLNTDMLQIKPAILLDSADEHTEAAVRPFSAKGRAILGVLLGMTIGFIWLVIPAFFQEKSI